MDTIFSHTSEKSEMDEAQKIRDRKMRGIWSSNRPNKKDIRRAEYAKSIIEDLEHHGPAGLLHIAVLSEIIAKPIKIWNSDRTLNSIIGKEKVGPAINVEYHANGRERIGHWTLIQNKDPDNTICDLNSCLFSVIGSQTGLDPLELRKWTVLKLKENFRQLADRLDEVLRSQGTNNEIVLMIGGACYKGFTPCSAGVLLDKSQNARCYNFSALGHPRGHVSNPSAIGDTNSVENYSRSTKRPKTGFLSADNQNAVANFILRSEAAKDAMNRLNCGSCSEEVRTSESEMKQFLLLPKAMSYVNGEPNGPEKDIRAVVMVLRHHFDKYYIMTEDVFIHTCYPTI